MARQLTPETSITKKTIQILEIIWLVVIQKNYSFNCRRKIKWKVINGYNSQVLRLEDNK